MKVKLLLVVSLLCLLAVSCKNKRIEVVEEPFDTHPEWTADNPDAFWE